MGGQLLTHIALIFKIFFTYIVSFLWPFGVTVLPPLYAPPLKSIFEFDVFGGLFVFLFLYRRTILFF